MWVEYACSGKAVRAWAGVAPAPGRESMSVRAGRLYGLRGDRDAELPSHDERRQCKYWVVCTGNAAIGQSWEGTVLQDLGNSPSTMSSGKLLDELRQPTRSRWANSSC